MRQVVTIPPIVWCSESQTPISFIGDVRIADAVVTSNVFIEESGNVTLGGRTSTGGCVNSYQSGYFFTINERGFWNIYSGLDSLKSGSVVNFGPDEWHSMSLTMTGNKIIGSIDGVQQFAVVDNKFSRGWIAIGTGWNFAQFDDFSIEDASYGNCGDGNSAMMTYCDNSKYNSWNFKDDGTIRPTFDSSVCLDQGPPVPESRRRDKLTDGNILELVPCRPVRDTQIFSFDRTDGTVHTQDGRCLDVFGANGGDCTYVDVYPCNDGSNQLWTHDRQTGFLKSDASQWLCLATGPN